MDELKFVLRCFGFAALLLVLTQLKTGNMTIESRIQASLLHTRTADFVNKVASGGVLLIKDAGALAKSTYQDWKKDAPAAGVVPAAPVAASIKETTPETAKNEVPNSAEEIEPTTEQEKY